MAYNIFTVVAAYYTMNEDEDGALVLLSALAALFQVKNVNSFIYLAAPLKKSNLRSCIFYRRLYFSFY